MNRLMIMVFADKSLIKDGTILAPKFSKKKQGASLFSANKGSVLCRVNIGDTPIVFANCHLKSGKGNINKRFAQLKSIIECISQKFAGVFE